jgi:Ca2+/Na+ antiporter
VLGANAANLLLILGAVSVAVPAGRIALGEQYLFIDLHFLLGATLALGTAMADGRVTPAEGLLLLLAYGVYVAYLLAEGRTATAEAEQAARLDGDDPGGAAAARRRSLARDAWCSSPPARPSTWAATGPSRRSRGWRPSCACRRRSRR